MANTATLAIQIISDATKAAKGFQAAGNETSKFESRLKTANKVALGVSATLLAVGAASLKQASDLQQSTGSVQATFGTQAKAVTDLAKKAAQAVGLSRASYQQTAAVFGAQLKNMGVAAKQLVPQTDKLIGLGADLAATYGGTTSDAVEAISSLLRGERDPIEKYGVSIKQADINARLAAQGQTKLTGAAKKNAETQAVLSILTKQTASAQGQFAKESNTAEGAAQRNAAAQQNLGASLGTILLPASAAVSAALAGLAKIVENHTKAAQIAGAVIAALAVIVIATSAATKLYAAAQTLAGLSTLKTTIASIAQRIVWLALVAALVLAQGAVIAYSAAQRVLNIVLAANPIGLVIAAIALLVAGFILAYKKSATFRAIVQATGRAGQVAIGWVVDKVTQLWQFVSTRLGAAFNAAKTAAVKAFNAIADPIRSVIDWVRKLIDKIQGIHWPSPPSWVTKVLSGGLGSLTGSYAGTALSMASGAGYGLAPAVFTSPGDLKASGPELLLGRMGRGGPGIIQITVNGALDPNAVAKQIENILRGRGLRIGTRSA